MKKPRGIASIALLAFVLAARLPASPFAEEAEDRAKNADYARTATDAVLHERETPAAEASAPRYTRTTATYSPPDVLLTSSAGTPTRLGAVLATGGPLFLQFIFTSCTTVCPVMSTSFAGVQSRLGRGDARLRFISISIDPAYDTPARLRDYARRFDAGAQWQFFTGRSEDIVAVQKAFASYPGNNKMWHVPVTFFRAAPGQPWVRLEGLPNAVQLLGEYRRAVK